MASVSILAAIVIAGVGLIVAGAVCMTRYTCLYDGFSLILMGVVQLCTLAMFALAFYIYDYFFPIGPPPIVTVSPV
jgi:hypothetical protein